MIILIKLVLAHLLGDFLLQPTSWVIDKEEKKYKSLYFYWHVLLHFMLAWLLVGEFGFAGFALILALLHGGIDLLKLHFQKDNTKRKWFVADQLLHLAVLLLITFLYENGWNIYILANPTALYFQDPFWMYLTAVVFLTKPASIIIRNIISVWTPEKKSKKKSSLQNAGNYIGIIERLFVFYFVATGHLEAVGFLLAAKSIFRFGDLREAKDRKLTEYVLIGTLLSFGFAFLTAILLNFCLSFA